jgi:hypothetical protein
MRFVDCFPLKSPLGHLLRFVLPTQVLVCRAAFTEIFKTPTALRSGDDASGQNPSPAHRANRTAPTAARRGSRGRALRAGVASSSRGGAFGEARNDGMQSFAAGVFRRRAGRWRETARLSPHQRPRNSQIANGSTTTPRRPGRQPDPDTRMRARRDQARSDEHARLPPGSS